MLVSTSLALSLGLTLSGLTSASPLLQHRRDDAPSDDVVPISAPGPDANSTDSILKPETIALLETTALTFGLPGAIVAYTSPKGDGVWTFGNRSVEGDAVTADVSLVSPSSFLSVPRVIDHGIMLIHLIDPLRSRVKLQILPRHHPRLAR